MKLPITTIDKIKNPQKGFGYAFIDAEDNRLKVKKHDSIIEFSNDQSGRSCKFYECAEVIEQSEGGVLVSGITGLNGYSDDEVNGLYTYGELTDCIASTGYTHEKGKMWIYKHPSYSYWLITWTKQAPDPGTSVAYCRGEANENPWELSYDWELRSGYGTVVVERSLPADASWAGYEWSLEGTTYKKSSTITEGLSWTSVKPEIGKTYTEDALVEIASLHQSEDNGGTENPDVPTPEEPEEPEEPTPEEPAGNIAFTVTHTNAASVDFTGNYCDTGVQYHDQVAYIHEEDADKTGTAQVRFALYNGGKWGFYRDPFYYISGGDFGSLYFYANSSSNSPVGLTYVDNLGGQGTLSVSSYGGGSTDSSSSSSSSGNGGTDSTSFVVTGVNSPSELNGTYNLVAGTIADKASCRWENGNGGVVTAYVHYGSIYWMMWPSSGSQPANPGFATCYNNSGIGMPWEGSWNASSELISIPTVTQGSGL
jgi:hypothetical protein